MDQRIELRTCDIGPLDRQFFDPEAEHLGQRHCLDIESKTLLLDTRKYLPGCVPAEGFEPALRIRKMCHSGGSENPVEDPARHLARQRLPVGNQAVRVTARPHEHIRIARETQKLIHEAQRNAEIGIHEKDPVAPGPEHAGLHGKSFAVCRLVLHDFKTGIPLDFVFCNLSGPVGPGLDNEEKLPWLHWKSPTDFPNRRGKTGLLISGRNDNTDSRGLIRHGCSDYPKRVPARLSKLPLFEIAIFCIAIFLRVWLIEVKPPHFDEGVNGWFADQMTANGFYRYDPTNYHGPLHFYAVYLSQTLFGRHLWALRLPAIIAGLLCIWAILRYREFFGTRTARIAALAMAVSPAYVFYGRYSIHESWQALFSILLLWGILGLWKSGERRYFYTAVLSGAGLVLTKETYLLHVGCFLLAGLVLWGWQRIVPSRPSLPLAKQLWTRDDAILACGLSILLIVFFYSGNFLDFSSLKGIYQTFAAWFKTGVEAAGHEKTTYQIRGLNYYWVFLMWRYEWPALAGLAACIRYIAPSDVRFRYTAIMAGGVLLAYSIIPYKTPWCIISIIWPFYLILGGLLGEVADLWKKRFLPWLVMAPLLVGSLVFCWRLNFEKFSDDSEPYVYVQTYPEIFRLTDPLLNIAKKDAGNYHMSGLILLDSYYPLPWMLGDFTRVGYYNKTQLPSDWNAGFIAVEKAREAEVEKHLSQAYFKRNFHLRSAQEECTAYFSAAVFSDYFGGVPEFQPAAR